MISCPSELLSASEANSAPWSCYLGKKYKTDSLELNINYSTTTSTR